jgi:DNA-binding PadR family transcriptional regulator
MKYSIYINQTKAIEWGLNLTEASVFAFCYELPSWANSITVNGQTWYQYSKTKIIEEYPLLTSKPDTIYRTLKSLEKRGLIELSKVMKIDHVKLTEKAKSWNVAEVNPTHGKFSENSEKNPSELGKKSENSSEKNPTYNNTNTNKVTNNKKVPANDAGGLFPDQNPNKKTLFRNSVFADYKLFEKQFQQPEFANVDLSYYFHSVSDWSDSANKQRTARGWIATARNFMRSDADKKRLRFIKTPEQSSQQAKEAMDYLKGFE